MDELAAKQILEQRDSVVAVLRGIANRLAVLSAHEVREPLRGLTRTVDALAHEADAVFGHMPDEHGPPWPTVVFVRRGAELEA
ncbi:MAG TPA: hypothetical protein VGR62_04940 [Candidatus Binatia bacterium]|jgi:hypothetical protein|nr:hypothetical protein [Candidatus Binatia bacterium]